MAGKNWQAGGRDLIPSRPLTCAAAVVLTCLFPCAPAWAGSSGFAFASEVGSLDPSLLWEVLIGGIVVCAFVVAVILLTHSTLHQFKRRQVHRSDYISSAL